MASPNRLYPSLNPDEDLLSTVVVSSDEECERSVKIASARHSSGRKSFTKSEASSRQPPGINGGEDLGPVLSLSDFEHSYFKENPSNLSTRSKKSENARRTVVYLKHCLLFLYKWKVILLGLLLALIAILCLEESSGKDNYLRCVDSDSDFLQIKSCIEDLEQETAITIAKKFRIFLHNRAGRHDCGDNDIDRGLTFDQMRQVASKEWSVHLSDTDIKNIMYLLIVNNHWGIRVYGSDDVLIMTDHLFEVDDGCSVESTRPHRALPCIMRGGVRWVWQKIRMILFILFVISSGVMFVRYYLHRKKSEEASVYMMVERVTKLLSDHYRKSQKNQDLLPYLAIMHVRDALIPPSERHKNQILWDKVVKWISTKESRVRMETRRIAGEDLPVWKWIYQSGDPTTVATEEPDSTWPGNVFDHYPPELENKLAPPVGTPSVCVRIKNMFEPVKKMDPIVCSDIRNAVVKKCLSYGSIVHVYVDKRSEHGCVYFKMDSLKSAVQVYKAFHGTWFRSRLVTAKYIPEQKYYKWFPGAAAALKSLAADK